MKKIILSIVVVLLISFTHKIVNADMVKLPNASVVVVKATEPINPKNFKAGQEVVMTVAMPVKIGKDVVIKAGTPVIGIINTSKEAQMAGIAGSMSVSVQQTTAVDGSNIAISGQFITEGESEIGATVAVGVILCPLAILNKGGEGIISAGTQIRATTIGEYNIKIE